VACVTAAAAATAFSDVVADSIVVELARASPGATEGDMLIKYDSIQTDTGIKGMVDIALSQGSA
jgi:hypothetical protein